MNLLIGIIILCYAGFCAGQTLFDMRKVTPKESKPPVTMQSQPNPGVDNARSPEGDSRPSEEVP
jgi:hypothetical protein